MAKTTRNILCITHEEKEVIKDNSAILPDHNIDTSRIPGNSLDIIVSSSFLSSTPVVFKRVKIPCDECRNACLKKHHLEIHWPPDRLH